MKEEDKEKFIKELAFGYLARYSCSSEKLKSFLIKKLNKIHYKKIQEDKGFIDSYIPHVDNVIKYLQQMGYLNDELYANYQFNYMINKGKSLMHIKNKFIEKGLRDQSIQSFSNEFLDNHNLHPEMVSALKFIKKKHLGCYCKNESMDSNKQITIMYRNGFNYDIIKKVLNMDIQEIENYMNNVQ